MNPNPEPSPNPNPNPEVMMGLGDWDAAERFVLVESRRHHAKLFSEAPTCVPWIFGLTLMAARRANINAQVGDPPAYPNAAYEEALDHLSNFLNGTIVFTAVQMNEHVLPLLLGEENLTLQPQKPRLDSDVSSKDQAVAYVRDNLALWKSVHGAIEWVFRCRNTYLALRHLSIGGKP